MVIEKAAKVRMYGDIVPERRKEFLSETWGGCKRDTFIAAERRGDKISVGESFNRVVTFRLEEGFYHLVSDLVWIRDISDSKNMRIKLSKLIQKMVDTERTNNCEPLFASNVCDWDSDYAKEVRADAVLRSAILEGCLNNSIMLTGGETANISDQVRKKGLSWMFTLLSRYDGNADTLPSLNRPIDNALYQTFEHLADNKKFEIVYGSGMPLLHVKEASNFVITADGTGTKSIVCDQVGKRTDIKDTLSAAGDDPTRDGAFPVIANISVHSGSSKGKRQIIRYMNEAGKEFSLPLPGSVFHQSGGIYAYTMNGVILSEVIERMARMGKSGLEPGLALIVLYELQRTNGITMQRRVLEETFGEKWYNIKFSKALNLLTEALRKDGEMIDTERIPVDFSDRTLGELVSTPSTPYFRINFQMPKEMLDSIRFMINVSSGGLTGKTRRAFEPFNLGAEYSNLFESPPLIILLQMASRLKQSKGIIPDEVAYYTWGCGNGAVIATTNPNPIIDYYAEKGLRAKIGGLVIPEPEIRITSSGYDAMLKAEPHILIHKYTDKPLV